MLMEEVRNLSLKSWWLFLFICFTFCALGCSTFYIQYISLETCLRVKLTLCFTQLFLCVLCAMLLCASSSPTEIFLTTYPPSSLFALWSPFFWRGVTLVWPLYVIHQWISFCIMKEVVVGRVILTSSSHPITTMVSIPLLYSPNCLICLHLFTPTPT